MAEIKNHLAVVSGCATGPASRGRAPVAVAALLSGILLAPFLLIDTADEVHYVPYVVLGEAVIDPARHGSSLHAIEDRIEQRSAFNGGQEGKIAGSKWIGGNLEGVGTFPFPPKKRNLRNAAFV